ncbi:MAG TPA: hypothetical protein VLO11_05445, partial [Luteolibacter sp.]|nr:hypothetical protein [Luteolibacter sp.]
MNAIRCRTSANFKTFAVYIQLGNPVNGFCYRTFLRLVPGLVGLALLAGCKNTRAMSDPFSGDRAGEQRVIDIGHGIHIDFRWAPSGRFMMGSPANDPDRDQGESLRMVEFSEGFWIAEYETTVRAWREVMGSVPAMRKASDRMPVACVSWHDCRELLKCLKP